MNERNRQIFAVYASGLLVGISLILFPSAGPLFTDPQFHSLNSAQFGVLFTPQIVTAILSSSLTATLARRMGMKRVMQVGLILSAVAMLLLVVSHLVIGTLGTDGVFAVLLLATAAIGGGFGFTISALNAYAFDLFPGREDSAVTAIHVATGTGQVGAALLLSFFVGVGAWWGAPFVIAAVIALMLLFQLRLALKLKVETADFVVDDEKKSSKLPGRVWLYAIVTFAYGAIEGTFGNWTPIYLNESAGLSVANAALGLSLFWAAVTVGRVLFAIAAARFNVKPLFYITPFVVGFMFLILPRVDGTVANFAAVIVAGLAISFFFPYAISRASGEYPMMTAAVSGSLVAGLQLGNGISANIVGVASRSTDLGIIFQLSALYAVLMAAVVIYLGVTRQKSL